MKSRIGIVAIYLSILFCISCNKQDVVSPSCDNQNNSSFVLPDSVLVSVDNGCLVFENEANLQTCINFLATLSTEDLDQFEDLLGYSSYRSSVIVQSEKVHDDLFATLMNSECKIIIGNYILTTNLEDETTTVTPIVLNLKSASTGRLDNVITLSWTEDAFHVMETGKREVMFKGYCGNTDRKKEWEDGKGNPGFYSRLQAKVCFQRVAWYNSIIIKFKLEHADANSLVYDIHYKTEGANYKPRKRSTVYFSRENSARVTASQNEISHRPYNSTRRVDHANVPVDFSFEAFNRFGDYIKSDSIRLTMGCS